jgi:glycine cleavage system H protein
MATFHVPEDYYYTKDHEWAQVDENIVTVGITEFAQNSLGEIVYVELPEEGQKVTQGESFGVVESVKAVSDLLAPVSGTVIEINQSLSEDPAVLNDDPINDGWLIRIEMDTEKELAILMRAPDYKKLIAESNK